MHKKKIIIEGPDGTGKTTLGLKLAKIHGVDFLHLSYTDDINELTRQFLYAKTRLTSVKGCVIDRFILSNIVYGSVFHNFEFISNWQKYLQIMVDILKSEDSELIICLPENKELYLQHFEKLTKSREEMYCSIEDMGKVYDMYEMYYELLKNNKSIKVRRFDWCKTV